MKNKFLILTFTSLYLFITNFCKAEEIQSAKYEILKFYKDYFNYDYRKTPNIKKPELKFSQSLEEKIKENTTICEEYSTGVCGWNASFDEYTNSQEMDPDINPENSRLTAKEIAKNTIQVKFNVYPSDNSEYYDRVITYKLILENNEYAVEDILYGDGMSSIVAAINDENNYYLKNPDPDSKFCTNERSNGNKTTAACNL